MCLHEGPLIIMRQVLRGALAVSCAHPRTEPSGRVLVAAKGSELGDLGRDVRERCAVNTAAAETGNQRITGFLLILEPFETDNATVPNPIFHLT